MFVPPDGPTLTQETREYLLAAAEVLEGKPTRRAYFDQMLTRFPQHLNPTIVWLSALSRIPED